MNSECHTIFFPFVVLTFDFFARCEEFVEEKSPGADAPRLAWTTRER